MTSDLPLDALTVDDGERPKMPPLPGATDAHRRQGRRLAAIHRAHLMDLGRIAAVLERIEAGEDPPEALRSVVLSTDMVQNYRAVGSLCGHECRMLGFHHDAEEQMMFPRLEAVGQAALSAVVARLRREHEVVHELLVRLERASMTLLYEPGERHFALLRDTFAQLAGVVRSHFGYEEAELQEALGMFLDDL